MPLIDAATNDLKTLIEERQASLEQYIGELNNLWTQVYELSWAYFNECLKANFDAIWSLGRNDCIKMRKTLVDTSDSIVKRRRDIHRLRVRLVFIHTEQRTLKSRATAATLTEAARVGITDRLTELSDEERCVETELFSQQGALTLREGMIQESQAKAIQEIIRTKLESARRLLSLSGASDSGYSDQTVRSASEPIDETSHHSRSQSPEPTTTPVPGEPSLEDVLEEYTASRRDLEALQAQFALEWLGVRDQSDEVDYLLTFTSLSPQTYAAHISRRREVGIGLLAAAEFRFEQAQEALLEAGIALPVASTRREEEEGSRSRRSTETARVRKLNRRRSNKYRFDQLPTSPASMTSGSRRSTLQLRTASRRSGTTASMSPSPRRNQRLDEYQQEQDRVRQEQEQRRRQYQ